MHRIDTADVKVNKFGAGKDGFTNGVPNTTPATGLDDDWCDAMQEELANTIEAMGITLVKGTYTQLLSAIRNLKGVTTTPATTVTAATGPAIKVDPASSTVAAERIVWQNTPTGAHLVGDRWTDYTGRVHTCRVAGTPGTFGGLGAAVHHFEYGATGNYMPPVGLTALEMILYGGGGGGGGVYWGGSVSGAGGGGAAGGCNTLTLTAAQASAARAGGGLDMVFGAAGVGGSGASGEAGATGGDTTVTQAGGSLLALASGGGGGGFVIVSSTTTGFAAGGAAASGTTNGLPGGGEAGHPGLSVTDASIGGDGGSAPVGRGGRGYRGKGVGGAAAGCASGGGGASAVSSTSSGTLAGGVGTAGVIEIIEHY